MMKGEQNLIGKENEPEIKQFCRRLTDILKTRYPDVFEDEKKDSEAE